MSFTQFTPNNIWGLSVSTVSTTGNYVVDSGFYPDTVILAHDGYVGLPAPTAGRVIIIKDYLGNSATTNIAILPFASETIDGSSSASIFDNFGSLVLMSDGTNWFVISGYNGSAI